AERYLTPDPGNIAARTAIRTEGLTLLRRLHEVGIYDRVAVVGHSLGSVIGYDVLRLFWDQARWPTFERAGPQSEAEQSCSTTATRCPCGGARWRSSSGCSTDSGRSSARAGCRGWSPTSSPWA